MLSGTLGYKIEDKLHFLSILNTYLIKDTFYKSKSDFISDFRDLIEKLAMKDPEFVVKALIYSRCKGSGLRAITQLGAVLALPFIKGTTLAEKLFRPYSKTTGKGGTDIPNALYYTLKQEKNYDRIIIISDNESTRYGCIEEYKKIIKANPNIRIYSIDLVPYGESSLPLDGRIKLYFGKTFKLFDDMILSEFNPDFYIEEVNKMEI